MSSASDTDRFLNSRFSARPNRLTANKDKEYHERYSRYIISKANIWQQTYFIKKYLVNMMFYKGNQWIFEEDMDSFLMDESGDVRNRIQFVHNIIKPYVEYFRGSLVKMDLNFTVNSISREAINKREEVLNFILFMQKAATDMKGGVADTLHKNYPIDPSVEKTIESFNNNFVDEYAQIIKHLVNYIADKNDFEDIRVNLGEDMAFGGIAIVKEYDSNEHQYFNRIYPPNFFWDLTAKKKDLKDADWMGDFALKSAVEINERYNPDYDTQKKIESIKCTTVPGVHNITDFLYGYTGDKVPLYDLYWRDMEADTHGLVFDQYGYVCIVDMDKDTKLDGSKYTDSDLIPEDKLKPLEQKYRFIKTLFKYKNKKKVTVEYIRFCTVIPMIYSGLSDDIILDYGIRPYTSKYHLEEPTCEYPYSIGTYAYMDSEVISPLDSLVSPQRYINRIMSMAESNVNNSRSAGTVIDSSALLDSDLTQEEVQSAMNRGKPILLNGRGNVQNAVTSYDNTIKSGTLTLFNIAKDIKSISDEIVGGGDALRGAGGGYRVSVGAIDQNLNQAITLQEPFFYAIYKAIFGCYQMMAGRGKRIYSSNEREITIMIGDAGYKTIAVTKDLETMDFRLTLDRAPSKIEQQQQANASLLQLLQLQLIDDKTYATYLNNCDMSDIPYILRKYLTVKYEALARQQQKQQRDANLDQVIKSAGLSEQNMDAQKNDIIGAQTTNANLRNKAAQVGMKNEAVAQQTPPLQTQQPPVPPVQK